MQDNNERQRKRDFEIGSRMVLAILAALILGLILFASFSGFFRG